MKSLIVMNQEETYTDKSVEDGGKVVKKMRVKNSGLQFVVILFSAETFHFNMFILILMQRIMPRGESSIQ